MARIVCINKNIDKQIVQLWHRKTKNNKLLNYFNRGKI